MNTQQQEILDILQEECAEVVQAVSKCRRFGIDTVNLKLNISNRDLLCQEIGDVMAMITLCYDFGIVDYDQVLAATDAKIEKLRTWSNIFKDQNEQN